jgi:hypothetical protein
MLRSTHRVDIGVSPPHEGVALAIASRYLSLPRAVVRNSHETLRVVAPSIRCGRDPVHEAVEQYVCADSEQSEGACLTEKYVQMMTPTDEREEV